jgi:hypothetical protein
LKADSSTKGQGRISYQETYLKAHTINLLHYIVM